MSITELRRKLKSQVDSLGEAQLRSAADYMEFLGRPPSLPKPAATPDRAKKAASLRRAVRDADRAAAEGKLVRVDQLRHK